MRKVLLQDRVGSNLLQSEEVNELLNLIEQELEQVHLSGQSEEYIKTAEKETEDAVNRLLDVCQVCEKVCEENICGNCANDFSSDFD